MAPVRPNALAAALALLGIALTIATYVLPALKMDLSPRTLHIMLGIAAACGLASVLLFVYSFAPLLASGGRRRGWLTLRRPVKEEGRREPGGYQDWPVEGSAALRRMAERAERITVLWSRFNERVDIHVAQDVAARGDLHANRQVGIAAGEDLAAFADELGLQITVLTSDADVVIESYVGLARWARLATAQDIGDARTFIGQMGQVRPGFRSAWGSMKRYRSIVLSKRGLNRAFDTGIARVVESLDRGISTFQKTDAAFSRAARILRRKACRTSLRLRLISAFPASRNTKNTP